MMPTAPTEVFLSDRSCRRPTISAFIACVSALLISSQVEISLLAAFLLLIFLVICLAFTGSRAIITLVVFTLFAIAFIIKFSFDLNTEHLDQLRAFFEKSSTRIDGLISSEVERTSDGDKFIMNVVTVTDTTFVHHICAYSLVRVSYDAGDSLRAVLRYGDSITLWGKIEQPSGIRNPGGFDYRRYLAFKGIGALVYVRGSWNVERHNSGHGNWVREQITSPFRERLVRSIRNLIPDPESAALVESITFGVRSDLSDETEEEFIRAGVVHVLAVSGFNVVVVLSVLGALFSFIPHRRTRYILLLVSTLLYCALCDFVPSVLRAGVMASMFLVARLRERRSSPLEIFCGSIVLILFFDTRQFFDAGFELSAAAVLSLILFTPSLETFGKKTLSWFPRIERIKFSHHIVLLFFSTIAAQIGTLPLIASYFGRFSLVGFGTNLIIVPIIALLTISGGALAILGTLSHHLGYLTSDLVTFLSHLTLTLVRLSAQPEYASVHIPPFGMWLTLAYFLTLLILFLPAETIRYRVRIPVALLILLTATTVDTFSYDSLLPDGKLSVIFFDVGQGDAALVKFPNGRTMMVDCGPRDRFGASSFDAGEKILVPALRAMHITHIDALILTHAHDDHTGGARAIVRQMNVGHLYFNGERKIFSHDIYSTLKEKNIHSSRLTRGDTLMLDRNYPVIILHPDTNFVSSGGEMLLGSSNNGSIVLAVGTSDHKLLLAGDVERDAEDAIVRTSDSVSLYSALLKVPHHGSKTSSTEKFITHIHPEHAVVSVGMHNSFFMPSLAVLARYREHNVEIHRTDYDGAIMFVKEADGWREVKWRDK